MSKKVAAELQIPVSKKEVVRFDNSEIRVTIQEDVQNEVCIVVQPTSNPTDTHLMELFFFADALKREGAKEVIGVVPYFGYARQNIQHRKGEDVSSNVVIKFLEAIGFSKIITFDIHDEGTQGIFTIPLSHLSAFPLFAQKIRDYLPNSDEVAVVSPDQGGIERARLFGQEFFGNDQFEVVVVEKSRDLDRVHESQAISIHGEVQGKTVILVDDIVTSGGTLINAAKLCLEKGATQVYAVVTHHDFSADAPRKITESPIEKFLTTDTIKIYEDQKVPKLEELTVASLIATELQKELTKNTI